MRILADENMPGVEQLFADVATELLYTEGRTLSAEQVAAADILLVRSITPVNAQLLSLSQPVFIGSATIGTDHVDLPLLSERKIPFAHAPGCNADAVNDYVLAALLALHADRPAELREKTLGVVGAGNVGQRVVARFRALGLTVKVCDPPRAERESDSEDFVSLYEALQSDIVCVHTPLTTSGRHATHHLLDASALALMPDQGILLNAGRGAVVDPVALKQCFSKRPTLRVVLDVWSPEPAIPRELLPLIELATGHVAGYSLEGKWRGTHMLRAAYAQHTGESVETLPPLQDYLPPGSNILVLADDPWQALFETVEAVYDVRSDDRRFRQAMAEPDHAAAFDTYRKTYPVRREFSSCTALVEDAAARTLLKAAGFQVR